jgi:hypothetical protein
MIEEMFSRLNESAPLAAPEKRNAYGGPLPGAIRKLAAVKFFTTHLPFPNRRYRHFDLATKFLFTENAGKVVDTKKVYLYKFVMDYASEPRNKMPSCLRKAKATVSLMAKVFTSKDPLLGQIGMVLLYYQLFRIAHEQGWEEKITRKSLADFSVAREANRMNAELDISKANYDLIEFDRYSQSPNDGYAIKLRLSVLLKEVFKKIVSIDDL